MITLLLQPLQFSLFVSSLSVLVSHPSSHLQPANSRCYYNCGAQPAVHHLDPVLRAPVSTSTSILHQPPSNGPHSGPHPTSLSISACTLLSGSSPCPSDVPLFPSTSRKTLPFPHASTSVSALQHPTARTLTSSVPTLVPMLRLYLLVRPASYPLEYALLCAYCFVSTGPVLRLVADNLSWALCVSLLFSRTVVSFLSKAAMRCLIYTSPVPGDANTYGWTRQTKVVSLTRPTVRVPLCQHSWLACPDYWWTHSLSPRSRWRKCRWNVDSTSVPLSQL